MSLSCGGPGSQVKLRPLLILLSLGNRLSVLDHVLESYI